MRPSLALDGVYHDNIFCGVTIGQSYADLAMWEEFLRRTAVSTIFEIGTYKGGMTLYLNLQMSMRDGYVYSFDNVDYGAGGLPLSHTRLFLEDVLSVSGRLVDFLKTYENYVLFLDNGNKELEYDLYSEFVKADCYLAVHDVGTEFSSSKFDDRFEELMTPERVSTKSLTAFLRRRK